MIADRVRMRMRSGSKSYMILTNGTRIDFEIENTPIANLCITSSSMVINGVSYTKSTVKEIHFEIESSYSGVTWIGKYFLYQCTSLTDITLDFPALTRVEGTFMNRCTSLTDITLNCPALTSVGEFFLNTCDNLINVTLNTTVLNDVHRYFLAQCWSLLSLTLPVDIYIMVSSEGFLYDTPRLESIYVPPSTVYMYATTPPWSNFWRVFKPIA